MTTLGTATARVMWRVRVSDFGDVSFAVDIEVALGRFG